MKILVTGGAGFLGQSVVQQLSNKNYSTFVVRSKDTNLLIKDAVDRLLKEYQPDVVIHLAATVGGIGANMANPGKFFYENSMMGLNVIHASSECNVKKFVMVGTVCSYPKYCVVPFRENDLWEGYPEETNAPYGVAKKALYVMLDAYKQQYGLNSTVLIPTNLYGPNDNFNPDSSHVIPALIRKIMIAKENNIKSISCWGSGDATREFLYVSDAADAIVDSINIETSQIPINLGGGEEISIRNLMQKLVNSLDYRGEIIWDWSKPDGQPRRFLDCSSAKEILGWQPKVSLNEGLDNTIQWYKKYVWNNRI